MKKFTETQLKLIKTLADGQCHNGNDLGALLKVSRTAIWKQITHLIELGLPIQALPQQGYRLTTPFLILEEETLRRELGCYDFLKPIHFHLFASIDSTNRFLKDYPRSPGLEVCCAELQTQGRGRFGRPWHSPFGENIYFSSRWHFDCDLSHLSGLSLVVSLAVLSTLAQFGIREQIRVKWPNDILWQDKKLCGTLIEIVAESNSSADVVIGVGINVNAISMTHLQIDRPTCSLYEITGKYFDRNSLIARLIIQLNELINEFMVQGFVAFMSKWHEVDYLKGQTITVKHPTGSITGIANGVDEKGQLLLVDAGGTCHALSSGDASLQRETVY